MPWRAQYLEWHCSFIVQQKVVEADFSLQAYEEKHSEFPITYCEREHEAIQQPDPSLYQTELEVRKMLNLH